MIASLVRLARRAGAAAVLLALPVASALAAQGVTSAALTGRVVDNLGAPVGGATVELVNTATGQRYQARAGADGRYFFENVGVGGPYTLDVRALGHEPARATDIYLRLGQRLERDFTLRQAAVEVGAVTVTAALDPLANTARTGAQSFVSETLLTRLPTLNRNFTDFINTVPQVNGTSVAGQNNRFNNIQIDGGVNNDLFGLAASGTPGGQARAHPISIEAVREYQVLIAPFDIRQGGFTGGLINAVTKSGTNELRGSVFGFLQNENFVGADSSGRDASEFNQTQYGFTLGGPIVRDRVHFFVATDLQTRGTPFTGQGIGTDTTGGADSVGVGIRQFTADRVQQIAATQYGFDPGSWDRPTLDNPDRNVFLKLSAQLTTNSQLELSFNHVNDGDDNLIRNSTATGQRDGYQLGNSGYEFTSKTNTFRAKWTSPFGQVVNNEMILGYQRIRDKRELPNQVPLMFVGGDRGGTSIAIGAERFSHANSLDQDILEITDNVTFGKGSHLITVGTHNEFFHFNNVFFPGSLGIWSFADTTAFKAGTPSRYERAMPGALRPDGPVADFDVQQLGFYVQDRWSVTPRLAVTAGLRVDVPVTGAPPTNPTLDTSVLNIDTGNFPSGNVLWSPRLGFNFDVRGDGSTFLRGGVGIFSGRPPYVWVSNAFSNTGLEQATLICDGPGGSSSLDSVPVFTIDPANQPTACAGPAGLSVPVPSINYFDADFKFPQSLKIAVGADQQLGWGLVATVDFLYTRWLNQFYFSDDNLAGIVGFATGEGGRALYGTVNATTGATTPTRRTSSFRDVIRHRNESSDRAYSVTLQLQKRFTDGLEFGVGYTHSRAEDLFSLTSSTANSNLRFTALDGTLENRALRTSAFDIPHKLVISGTANLPFDVRVSMIYTGSSGTPYTYTVSNDNNGDGLSGNDVAYIPRDATDITLATPGDWATLDAFINGEECLREHRGTIMARNSCRNPWQSFVDMKLSKVVPTVGGQALEITADLFNVLHLINEDWGLVRQTSGFEQIAMLRQTGYDATNQRGRYALALPTRNRLIVDRWRIQAGVRYNF